MKIFKCDTQQMTLTIVDLPRNAYHYVPPSKLQVALTVAVIVLTAIAWSLF